MIKCDARAGISNWTEFDISCLLIKRDNKHISQNKNKTERYQERTYSAHIKTRNMPKTCNIFRTYLAA